MNVFQVALARETHRQRTLRAIESNECGDSLDLSRAPRDTASDPLSDTGVIAVCDALRINTSVRRFSLSGNDAGDASAEALARVIAAHPQLTDIDISGNRISDTAWTRICRGAASSLRMRRMVCDGRALVHDDETRAADVSIGDAGARVLAQLLCTACPLDTVSLRDQDSGAIALASALLRNATLAALSLAGNRVADAGLAALFGALASGNCTLAVLDVSGMPFGDTSLRNLVAALRSANALRALRAHDCKLYGRALASVFAAVAQRSTPLDLLDVGASSEPASLNESAVACADLCALARDANRCPRELLAVNIGLGVDGERAVREAALRAGTRVLLTVDDAVRHSSAD